MKHQEDDALLTLQVRLERWVRQNKIKLISLAGVIATYFVIFGIWNAMENIRIESANEALNRLVLDPTNQEAKAQLEAKSPELYDLYLLHNASKNYELDTLKALSQKQNVVGTLAEYQLSSINGNFDSFSQKQGTMLKEFSALQEGYLLLKAGKKADSAFGKIALTSDLRRVSDQLEHYKAK